MATTTVATTNRDGDWKAGVVGGLVGAFVMGVLVLLMNAPTLTVAIPSLYGLAPPPSPGAGLFVHLSHGAVLGVVFAAILGAVGSSSTAKTVGIGAAWGGRGMGVLRGAGHAPVAFCCRLTR